MNLVSTDRPAYRILATAGFFGPDDTLYEEGTEIFFDGEPNEEMEPLNESARVKLKALLEKLDNLGRAAAEKAGRPFVSRPRGLDGQLALASAVQRAEMSVMGKKGTQDNETIEKIDMSDLPDTSLGMQKRGRGRPKGSTKRGTSLVNAAIVAA